uniref:NAA35-like TPR repeats domain-containing protein n=1 Tax=Eucampia antarctica TaxID=49252 RepID=A0A7S2SAQ4_9STRA
MIQKEASAIDYLFREEHKLDARTTPYVTNYVLSITVSILEHYLSLSIELDLFTGHHDLSIAFWYWDFLMSTQLNVSNMMLMAKVERDKLQQTIILQEEQNNAPTKLKREKKKGKRGEKGKRGGNKGGTTSAYTPPEMTAEDVEDQINYLILGLKRTLCRGTVRFIAALTQAGICKKPKYEFTSQEKRYEKRFELFQTVNHPPALKYDDYVQGSDFSSVSQLELITSASECFKSAKVIVDNILENIVKVDKLYLAVRKEEVMKLAKVCVGNNLYLHKMLLQAQKGNDLSNSVMMMDFKSHNQFCSITIN